ncbi:hypothetical protein SAMN05421786_101738 [Chryseobacterium ureilyticum]|uniref:Lipoprotein n=1 Tax=Chryseobacterium ureilyticum TaxID=373668 RepID=A0A1N7KTR7_9FLAO|nr:hypothetical protein [Chryseobacterium ureilyticum]SIS64947.1 hypothetical protein SAMN05421786_101738 [Chryseobacterium ureilyticum]
MEIKRINKIILLLVVLFFYGCKEQNENQNPAPVIQDTQTKKSHFELQKKVSNNGNVFQYADMIFEIKSKEELYDILINNDEFFTEIILDSPDLNIWYYKYNEDRIILLEGNDYYGSSFYAYHLINNNLFYLGDFTIQQLNIENEKPYKKEFEINIEKDKVIIQALLNGKPSIKNAYKDHVNQIRKKDLSINPQIVGNLAVKWLGKYHTTLTNDKKSTDSRDTDTVELIIKKDSVVFHVDRYWGEYNYLLRASEVENGIKLTFDKVLDGDVTDVLQKTNDFGRLFFDGKNYYWQCPYLDMYYNNNNKKYVLNKMK